VGQGGWLEFGGTSVATPIIAAGYALAGPPQAVTNPAEYPYDDYVAGGSHLNDVTSGADGTCTPAYLCTAGAGYDGPTGLGTPDGVGALVYHPHGELEGTITDGAGHPVADALTSIGDHVTLHADSTGKYDASLPAGA
jgi:hypothetical protein